MVARSWPFEQAAGNDILAIRNKYGKNLIIGGGIDKKPLIKEKKPYVKK